MLSNSHGQFDSSGKRFTIADPATPMPWVNVISNGRYGLAVSQNGGGFSWLDNSQLNVLTRWEMDLIRDDRGRFLFVSDLDSGEVWSATPAPCWPKFDHYSCEHTQGRTTFTTEVHGIRIIWTLAVSPTDTAEVWSVGIENHSGRSRRLRISSFFEWCCGVAPDTKREFHRLFITTSFDTARSAVLATKNMWDLPSKHERDHWNRPWPYVAAHSVIGKFEKPLTLGEKRAFTGIGRSAEKPAAMTGPIGDKADSTFGRFGDAAAALGGDLTLAPGATAKIGYCLAIGDDEVGVKATLDHYRSVGAIEAAIEAAGQMWETMLAPSGVQSGMPDFDLLNSTWLPYQAISGRLWARTGYYQQSGAFGFRDQLQDSMVWLPRDPSQTRRQILLHAAHQFADGSVYHWWHPLAEFGLRTACSDDYLWLPYVIVQYIRDTDDWSVLDEVAPFVDDAKGATVLDHCKRSIKRSLSRQSPRGLPLIGSCDWNDGLSALGVEERGESVWLAQWLCVILAEFATVLERPGVAGGDAAIAREYRAHRERLVAGINSHAWDGESGGEWYRAATRDDGRWIGTATNTQGRIFLNTQTWAILSDTAPQERADAAWASVKRELLRPMGPLLSAPAYSAPDPTVGYITRYAPGLRENGGVYMHAATWALAAACKRKDIAAVEQIWRAISPPLRGRDAAAYHAEPYVTPGNVDGPDSAMPGRAGWTWYTGSAAWLNRVSLEWIIGMRAEWEGLRIDPAPFAALGKVDAKRTYRRRTVRVKFDAAEFNPSLPARIMANGRPIEGNIIRAEDFPAGQEIIVEVSWGMHVNHAAGRSAGAATVRHALR